MSRGWVGVPKKEPRLSRMTQVVGRGLLSEDRATAAVAETGVLSGEVYPRKAREGI